MSFVSTYTIKQKVGLSSQTHQWLETTHALAALDEEHRESLASVYGGAEVVAEVAAVTFATSSVNAQ